MYIGGGMKSNELLETICDRLAVFTPKWKSIIRRMKEQRPATCSRDIDFFERRGNISEVYLQVSLDKICRGMKKYVDLRPIPDGASSENYEFRVENGRLKVYSKGVSFTDYDAVIKVNDLPVIFEIKLAKFNRSECGNHVALRLDRIEHIGLPAKEFFNVPDFGYAAVITKECVSPRSIVQRTFTNAGGILVPFCGSYSGFREKIKVYSEKFKLFDLGVTC